MRIFENLNVDFLGKRKFFYVISGTLFLFGLINIVFRGLEFGVDFKGGSEIVLQFSKQVDISNIRDNVKNIGLEDAEVKTFGGETGVLIRTELQEIPREVYPRIVSDIEKTINDNFPGLEKRVIDSTSSSITYQLPNPDTTDRLVEILNEEGFEAAEASVELDNRQIIVSVGIADWIEENLRESMPDNPFEVLKEDKVGPKVGRELKEDAVIALFLSLVVILIYLAFRFKFVFALGAVASLFHNVLITLGLFSILYNVIPGLNLEIDLTIVAAFLTLIGYSINDTVVIFDRIRENMKIHKTLPLFDVINMSVNKTMSRTVLTGGTTLLTLLVLTIFGGEVLRAFAFTLFFGIIIGTYSSIFVAGALVYEYVSRSKKKVQF
ncbi:MAG: protein-export membrane protein SecF [Ignavibacteria bacterium RIFOXYA2_FULL_37_17]|nr:MAG: protein-export membrane protein SecF [Ignavibacteria bacterium RIFOXYA2_FULL_37_17]